MTNAEARDWVLSVDVAGEPFKFSERTVVTSDSIKFEIIEPMPEQLREINFGQPLRQQEGDPKNEIFKDGDKIMLVVYAERTLF